jgi:ferredoxin
VHIKVKKIACQGNGRCYEAAPDVYELDDLGYNVGGEFDVDDEQFGEAALKGASVCPEKAILVTFD